MHPPRTALVAASAWLALALPLATPSRPAEPPPDPLRLARERLERREPAAAAAMLEASLATISTDARPAALGLLKQAYEAAAREAESAGRRDRAEEYRDNLAILERTTRRAATAGPASTAPSTAEAEPPVARSKAPRLQSAMPETPPASTASTSLPNRPLSDPAVDRAVVEAPTVAEPPAQEPVAPLPPVADPGRPGKKGQDPPAPESPQATTPPSASPREIAPGSQADPRVADTAGDAPVGTSPTPATNGAPASGPAVQEKPGVDLTSADAAFTAKKYEVAGPIYAELARQNALPPNRRDHWAYCRAVEVVRRINARPATAAEWAAIDAEIETIRRLSPTNWFAEYLRNRAAERNPAARASQGPAPRVNNKVVVRGSSPEEGPPTPTTTPPTAPPRRADSPPPGGITPAAADESAPPAGSPSSTRRWSAQPVFTVNFQVVFPEGQEAIAEQVGKAAEVARATLVKRWGEPTPGLPWAPRCEILLFANADEYSKATGQPPESPGISTMRMTEGRIDGRRVHLRLDHPNMIKAVLPHEVTHVVLADLFPHKQIPRWADEGMAVLSEPVSEQDLRTGDLDEPLSSGRLFRVRDLVTMDYPDPQYLPLYYAQSVSLTRYLVQQGSPAQFLKFVQQAQWSGFEPALKQVYEIGGYDELQSRWLTYAKAKASSVGAVAAAASDEPAAATRRD